MRFNFVACCLGIPAIIFAGCTTETVYLQDLVVTGPVKQPPLHMTEKNRERSVTFSPWVSLNTQESLDGQIAGHSMVNANGIFAVDTVRENGNIVRFEETQGANIFPYTGKTIHWTLPGSTYGVDINVTSSSLFAFSLGLSYASAQHQGLWGGDLGFAFMFDGDGIAERLEFGIQWQTLSYTASSIVVKSTSYFSGQTVNSVAFFEDKGRVSPINIYGSFTINTTADSPVNYFVQVSMSQQRVADFQPAGHLYVSPFFQFGSQDKRVQNSATFVMISPGVCVKMTEASQLLLGGRIIFETEIERSDPSVILMPMLKIDWKL